MKKVKNEAKHVIGGEVKDADGDIISQGPCGALECELLIRKAFSGLIPL